MRSLLVALLALVVLPARAQSGDLLVVCNQGDATVRLLDATTGETLATFSGFEGPHEVVVTPDARFAVVSDYGDQDTQGRRLAVVDLDARAISRWIDLGEFRRPHDLLFLPDGRLAVTAEVNRAVLLVDVASGAITDTLDTQQRGSHMLALDGMRVFTANISDGSVTEMDAETGETLRVIPAAPFVEGIALTTDGREIWVSGIRDGRVTVLDRATGAVLDSMAAPGFPYRVTMTPDGRHALVPGPEADAIRVFDVATREEVETITVDGAPGKLTVAPDGRAVYFPLNEGAAVGVLDLETLTVVRTLPTGAGPDGLAVVPRQAR